MNACAYILECGDGSLYTGWTNDIKQRLAAHSAGKASRYTRSRLPVKLRYVEPCGSKREAMARECRIKKMSRSQKLQLISEYETGSL